MTGRLVRVRAQTRRLPAPVVGLLIGVVYGVARGLVGLVLDGRFAGDEALVTGIGWSLLGWGGIAVSRRQEARPGWSAAQQAVSRGALPDDADPETLTTGLLHVKRSAARTLWWTTVLSLALAVSWMAFLRPSDIGWTAWVGVAAFFSVGAPVVLAVATRIRLRTADRLLTELGTADHQSP